VGQLPEILLADASVLIDYVETDRGVLRLTSRLFARLLVARPVLEQVPRLGERACGGLGIEVVDADPEMLVAASTYSAALGFEDSLCLLLCAKSGWTCVTNDGALARSCESANVQVRRGFNLLLELVAHGQLAPANAVAVASAVQAANPRLALSVLAEFEQLVAALAERK
jgi:hypothetical protein